MTDFEAEPELGEQDVEYLEQPEGSLCCGICLGVAREPWQHGDCGQLFCTSCLECHQKLSEVDKCPLCRMDGPQYFRDNRSKSEIVSMVSEQSLAPGVLLHNLATIITEKGFHIMSLLIKYLPIFKSKYTPMCIYWIAQYVNYTLVIFV